jgi:hypothetical protein
MNDRGARRALALVAALLVAGCATQPRSPAAFAFGVMGDTPYNEREEGRFVEMIERMNAVPLAFVVHVGDFKGGGGSPCSDALFEKRRAQFNASRHPLVYTPGDNDWTDCRRPSNGGADPIERLGALRRVFFADGWSLGTRRIETRFQGDCVERRAGACVCPAHPENRRWTHGAVVFATLNIPGSNNNVGFDQANDEEARCRDEANARWLEEAADESGAAGMRGLVVLVQADPWATRKPVYKPFLARLAAVARRLGKPVLFVHGDSHTYIVDTPFADALGQPLATLVRMETFGSPIVGWVKVTVDPGRAELFGFEPRLIAVVPPR